jgi:hypothetical protein
MPQFDIVDTFYDVGGFQPDVNYRFKSDTLPVPDGDDGNDFQAYGFVAGYKDFSGVGAVWELLNLERLDDKAFSILLERAISDLSDDIKLRVTESLERLRPSAQTTAQDNADQIFRSEWARKSSPRESHDRAIAERLESIACVADGAPYVALGLLRAKRFDGIYENKEANEKEKMRIFARLKKGAHEDDKTCTGAVGIIDASLE